ncbi:MAG: TonB-dependent receptor plug domain-containing protein, partial [Ferruginibacter sp.]
MTVRQNTGVVSAEDGSFPSKCGRSISLLFISGFTERQKNFFLSTGETESVRIQLKPSGKTLETVTIADEKERKETGLIKIDPSTAVFIPSTTGGVEALIKTLVGSNNELTSQYNVRGGNYDENLIYINDFEIYRPYLVSSGQQEGLSLINPQLTKNVNFYTGGFQSRYGDKM